MTRVIAQHALGKSVTNLWQNSGKISQNEKSQEKRSCRSTSENGRVSFWIVWRKAPNSSRIRGPKIWPGTDQEVFNSFWSPRAPPGYRAFPWNNVQNQAAEVKQIEREKLVIYKSTLLHVAAYLYRSTLRQKFIVYLPMFLPFYISHSNKINSKIRLKLYIIASSACFFQ